MPLSALLKRQYAREYRARHPGADIRIRDRKDYYQEYDNERGYRYRPGRKQARCIDRIIGVDGEGQGRRPHKYTYIAGADESGQCWDCYDDGRPLSTQRALDFLLSLPGRTLVVAYAFNYDLTKILTDIDNRSISLLFNEKKRAYRDSNGKVRYKVVRWQGYRLDYMNRRFTVEKDGQRTTIWDIWRFFQGKFTKALTDWKVGSEKDIEQMSLMKDQRSHFDKLKPKQVQAYCQDECKKLAALARSLINAHEDAGLKLKSYYGSGSTSSALLNKLEIKKCLKKPPEAMRLPVAMAFFGGRFENSIVGPVERRVYNYDISSAYPYQITLLPCLLHGRWEYVSNPRIGRIDRSHLALVHWKLRSDNSKTAWGPFPVRASDGTITFPKAATGGWCWKQEYLSGLKRFPNVSCTEAWLYRCDCDHQPFKDIPYYYLERLKLGKGGKGDVFKSGPNGVYGKLAQSKGVDPPFQNWVYAGNITSGTRAQLLDAFKSGEDLWHILMFATDSVSSLRPLTFPKPKDTGTWSAKDKGVPAPLGGWTIKEFPSGVFCVRPGIWFPLNPTDDDLKEVRARGLGKKVLYENVDRIVEQWKKTKAAKPLVITGRHQESCSCGRCPEGLARFVGAKSSISYGAKSGYKRSQNYGEWVAHEIRVSFSPLPKRETILADYRLKVWDWKEQHSIPYDPAVKNPEVEAIEAIQDVIEEQPNLDL